MQLDRKSIMVHLDTLFEYLTKPNTEHEASLVLGEIADRLCAMGFVASEKQMSLPVESYTIQNQLGDKGDTTVD